MIVIGTGSLEQDLAFTEPGLYRLSLSTASRVQANFGFNPIKASFYRCGTSVDSATEIATFPVNATNFVERTALFRVPSAGFFTLRLQGQVTTADSDRLTRLDAVSVKKVSDLLADTPSLNEKLELEIASGANLRLDYPGTNEVARLRIAGHAYTGYVTAANCSSITGPGALYVRPRGTTLFFR